MEQEAFLALPGRISRLHRRTRVLMFSKKVLEPIDTESARLFLKLPVGCINRLGPAVPLRRRAVRVLMVIVAVLKRVMFPI